MHDAGVKIIKICACIFSCICFYKAYLNFRNAACSQNIIGILFDILFVVSWAIVGGILLWWIFCPRLSEMFTESIFGGRKFLDHKPLMLSEVQGMISAGNYEEAAVKIQELYAEYPLSPELNLLIFEFYLYKFLLNA